MKIFWIIFALIIGLLLLCPFSVKMVYETEVTLKIGYLFPVIRILPAKPKKKKVNKKSQSKQSTSSNPPVSKKTAKKSDKPKSKNRLWEFTKKQGLDGIIELLKEIVDIVLKLVDIIRRHLVISKIRLDLLVVGEEPADTAMKYGYACSAIYPLMAVLDQHTRLKCHQIYIDAGFHADKTMVRFELKAHIMPIFVLIGAVGALIKSIGIFQKISK